MLAKINSLFSIISKGLFISLIVFVILESCSITNLVEDKEYSCQYATVAEIVSVEHSDVTVRLDNGEIKVINEPHPAIKVGSSVATSCQYIPVNKAIQN